MATLVERKKKYQEQMRAIQIRFNKMLQLYKMKSKLDSINARYKGKKLKGKTMLRHREAVKELEASIARKKEETGITIIVNPKKIRNQLSKLRAKILKLDESDG